MDPVLAQIIAQMMQGDSDLSGLKSGATSPLMMYLSGAYNPMANMDAVRTPLWTQYEGNPEYPGVNQIIELIKQGADKFQVMTTAKGAANRDIFDSATFDQLAGQLWEDYNKNRPGGENDFWAKNNLSRPEDVYTMENLPMGPAMLNVLRNYQSQEANLAAEYDKLNQQAEQASKEYKAAAPRKPANLQEARNPKVNLQKATTPEVNLGRAKTPKVNLQKAKTPKGGLRDARNPELDLQAALTGKTTTPEALDSLKQKSIQAGYDAKEVEDKLKIEKYLKDKFLQGYLGEAQRRGATPLNDQLKQLAKFQMGLQ